MVGMRRRSVLFVALATASVAAIALAAVWSRFNQATVATVAAIMAVAATYGQALPTLLAKPQGISSNQVDDASVQLAASIRRQWVAERQRRGLEDAEQMPIRWSIEGSVGTGWPTKTQAPFGGDRSGELRTLIDEFVAHPCRLVVTGEAGTGKSGLAVLLTLAFLANISAERPVPVLLQASSWDPAEPLHGWIARRLAEDYPWLPAKYGSTVCLELAERVLPVLDGLDEMPRERQAAALTALHEATLTDDPLVLTCRSKEFVEANAKFAASTRARRFPATLMVSLQPLQVQAAVDYLLDAARDAEPTRWAPVTAELLSHQSGPLATVLTRPLMLFLARTVYADVTANPGELLEDQFREAKQVEAHLLDAFVPTVFQVQPAAREPNPSGPRRRWDPVVVRRALAFLACFMASTDSQEFAWWELHTVVPVRVFMVTRAIVAGTVCGILGALLFGLFGAPLFGLLLLVVGVLAALTLGATKRWRPRRLSLRVSFSGREGPRLRITDLLFGVLGGMVSGLIVALVDGPVPGLLVGLVVALVFPFIFWLIRQSTELTESNEAIDPGGVLRSDRATVGFAALVGAATGMLVGALIGWVIAGPSDHLVVKLDSQWQVALLGAAVGAVVNAVGLGLIVLSTSAWGRFITTRTWLALRHHTPRQLMSFLEDAHRAGTLRQDGPYYQFRHALLQERLIEQAETQHPPPAPAVETG